MAFVRGPGIPRTTDIHIYNGKRNIAFDIRSNLSDTKDALKRAESYRTQYKIDCMIVVNFVLVTKDLVTHVFSKCPGYSGSVF